MSFKHPAVKSVNKNGMIHQSSISFPAATHTSMGIKSEKKYLDTSHVCNTMPPMLVIMAEITKHAIVIAGWNTVVFK